MTQSTTDKNGNTVKEGDMVRVLSIGPDVLDKLSSEEKENIKSMLGDTFEIEEIDELGNAWVTKWLSKGKEQRESHSIGLSASEMELSIED